MKTKTIRQTVTFAAQPLEIYNLIMDSRKHSAFTHSKVTMSRKPNGRFVVFNGYCHGFNIELKEGKKIIQAWHFAEDGWPDDHFSICTFNFKKTPKGTQVKFSQTGIPEHNAESLKSGWKEFYWGPIKAYLNT